VRIRAPAPAAHPRVGRAIGASEAANGRVASMNELKIAGLVGLALVGALFVVGFLLFVASGPGICGPTSRLGEFLASAGLLGMGAAALLIVGSVIVLVMAGLIRVLGG